MKQAGRQPLRRQLYKVTEKGTAFIHLLSVSHHCCVVALLLRSLLLAGIASKPWQTSVSPVPVLLLHLLHIIIRPYLMVIVSP